jgi:hypothetical protein
MEMAGLAAVASLVGTAVSAIGTIAAGKAQQNAANYEAAQMEVKAKEERASAQRDAMDMARKRRLALSNLQARAAGSGLGAADPTVLDLTGEVAQYGTYQEQLAMYGGESRSEELKASAAGRRAAGAAAMQNAYFGAADTILGGVSSMFNRYGRSAGAGLFG